MSTPNLSRRDLYLLFSELARELPQPQRNLLPRRSAQLAIGGLAGLVLTGALLDDLTKASPLVDTLTAPTPDIVSASVIVAPRHGLPYNWLGRRPTAVVGLCDLSSVQTVFEDSPLSVVVPSAPDLAATALYLALAGDLQRGSSYAAALSHLWDQTGFAAPAAAVSHFVGAYPALASPADTDRLLAWIAAEVPSSQ